MPTGRTLAERINQLLDDIEAPSDLPTRASVFAKMFDIQKPAARAILTGSLRPNPQLLEAISEEFEVGTNWLLGEI